MSGRHSWSGERSREAVDTELITHEWNLGLFQLDNEVISIKHCLVTIRLLVSMSLFFRSTPISWVRSQDCTVDSVLGSSQDIALAFHQMKHSSAIPRNMVSSTFINTMIGRSSSIRRRLLQALVSLSQYLKCPDRSPRAIHQEATCWGRDWRHYLVVERSRSTIRPSRSKHL